jgi:hypothetical protein
MIGVTSGIAFAADAPPSVTPNSGLAAPVRDAPASPAPPPAAPPEATSPTSVPVSPKLAAPQPAAPAGLDLTAPQPAAAEQRPITSKWWFWAAIGAAVVGASVAIYLVERTPAPPGCPTAMGYLCPR